MATSGQYSFSVSRDDIVREALLNIKVIDGIDPIQPEMMSDVTRKLNLMVQQWMGKADFAPGLKVWTRERGHLFLSNITGQYSLSSTSVGWASDYDQTTSTARVLAGATAVPVDSLSGMLVNDKVAIELDTGDLFWSTIASFGTKTINLSSPVPSSSASGNVVFAYTTTPQQPLLIEAANLRDMQFNDMPLNIMDQRTYDFLPNKVNPQNKGDPGAIYYENKLTKGILYTDVAATTDVTKHIVLTYMQPVQGFVNGTDTPYYPTEWYMALCWGLSKQCAPMYNADWSALMQDNYTEALTIARRKDPDTSSMYFAAGQD